MTPQDLFSLLSDETRLRCLSLLGRGKPICVCEFGEALEISQPKISRHLALLRSSGLVLDERRGQWVYYRLNDELEKWIERVLRVAFEQLSEREPFASDEGKMATVCSSTCC